jgi:hypothetical protein
VTDNSKHSYYGTELFTAVTHFIIHGPHSQHFILFITYKMGQVSYSVCPWQAFPALCNVIISLMGPLVSYEENEVL